jgi:predicted nucleic-acid-binding Zn-ribbon protein
MLNVHSNRTQTRGLNMSENKKCPKCGNAMIRKTTLVASGYYDYSAVMLMNVNEAEPHSRSFDDNVVPFYCPNCGYIELYNEKNVGKK